VFGSRVDDDEIHTALALEDDGLSTLIGKYDVAAKATGAAPTLLPLPERERAGVRVHRGAGIPLALTLSPSGGEGNGAEPASGFF
jgi:hypothetical protein